MQIQKYLPDTLARYIIEFVVTIDRLPVVGEIHQIRILGLINKEWNREYGSMNMEVFPICMNECDRRKNLSWTVRSELMYDLKLTGCNITKCRDAACWNVRKHVTRLETFLAHPLSLWKCAHWQHMISRALIEVDWLVPH